MYIPVKMTIKSVEGIHDFIEDFNFGTLVSNVTETLTASHLPFLLNRAEGEFGTLYFHFARANPQWRSLEHKNVMVIFNGPQAYISPTWYASAPAVPTWNYATAHVHGVMELLDDQQTIDILNQTIEKHDPELLKLEGAQQIITEQYRDKLLKGIVGGKITITNIEGKEKLGQHRTKEDQQGVVAGLHASNSPDGNQLLSYMRKTNIGLGIE